MIHFILAFRTHNRFYGPFETMDEASKAYKEMMANPAYKFLVGEPVTVEMLTPHDQNY